MRKSATHFFLFTIVLTVFTQKNTHAFSETLQGTAPGTADTMCADFLGRHWVATKCKMDTVADEWLSAKKHAFLFEIVGIGGNDTLHVVLPNYLGTPVDTTVTTFNRFMESFPSTTIVPRMVKTPDSSRDRIVYYRYFPLDTGEVDTGNTFPIDYATAPDVSLHTMHVTADKCAWQTYSAYGGHPAGTVHITHYDPEYIAGTFSFDVSLASPASNNVVHITNGRFRYRFPKSKKK
ncbi:MAG TPA: hypothetical protein VFA55_09185 [Candidatus Kapabacteria bacterium]|nr:hypothetical protein [Candidatus Kapabacteria bacterium]